MAGKVKACHFLRSAKGIMFRPSMPVSRLELWPGAWLDNFLFLCLFPTVRLGGGELSYLSNHLSNLNDSVGTACTQVKW